MASSGQSSSSISSMDPLGLRNGLDSPSSESLSPAPNASISAAAAVAAKRKNTSFKITNILPSRPPSNDPEESGEDDPDDYSHTEDLPESSSNDTEAPQSPRKFSSALRRNSFDAAASAAAALVAAGGTKEAAVSILSSSGLPASAMTVLLSSDSQVVFSQNAKWVSSILSVSHHSSSSGGLDARMGPKDRFKVVRMETTAPLKRGRWTCIDYIDKRSIGHNNHHSSSATTTPSASSTTTTNHHAGEKNELTGGESCSEAAAAGGGLEESSSLSHVRLSCSSNPPPQTPSMVQSPSGGPPTSYSSAAVSSAATSMLQQLYQKSNNPQQQQVIQFASSLLPQQNNSLVSSSSISSSVPVPSPQIATAAASYITPLSFGGLLPATAVSSAVSAAAAVNNSSAVSSIPPSRAEASADISAVSASHFYPAHFDTPIDNEHLVERLEEISTQQNAPSLSSVEEDIDNSCEVTNSSSNGLINGGARFNHSETGVFQSAKGFAGGSFFSPNTTQVPRPRYLASAAPPTRPGLPSSGLSHLPSRAVSPAKERPVDSGGGSSSNKSLLASFYSSASGTNQGAIDNRIEQAMDLVKSHLMNAVRSEVEELKERILKLEDVISHLQNENDFLKSHVPNEVLSQLPPPTTTAAIATSGASSTATHLLPPGGQQLASSMMPASMVGGLSPLSSAHHPLVPPSQQQQQQL